MEKPMIPRSLIAFLLITMTIPGGAVSAEPSIEVVAKSDIELQPLNPLRGDASPKAGVLWGDIKQNLPTGTLIEFVDGFSSPPHIHNITYRAVVISGAVHNDDPDASAMWMGPGSFWTQPAGEPHITAARAGDRATAFLEILAGPYLVQPSEQEFDNGERPINLEARNIVWLDASDVAWIDQSGTLGAGDAPQIAFLWGSLKDGQKNGTFLKLPAGFAGELRGNGAWLRAVVIAGQALHNAADQNVDDQNADDQMIAPTHLDPGSYFGSQGAATHAISCAAGAECLIYISTEGRYQASRL